MTSSLSQRLQALADALKETLGVIQELKTFSAGDGNTDERRLELATDIHERLREHEDTLEILGQEVQDDNIPTKKRNIPSSRPDRENEHERNADHLVRLQEDLKSARANFRRAQLQAKRESENLKRQNRELLFTGRKDSADQGNLRRTGKHEKLTQDEIALRSADDVTQALRRIHNQLEGELAQSQFAQQTLNESQDAMAGLSESYTGTTDLLKSSRGLVSQLVRSSKSDSWYLRSAWWMLILTIAWLFYRRILYGPSLLLIYYPFRMLWFTLGSIGTIILGNSSTELGNRGPLKPSLSVSMPAIGIPRQRSVRPPMSMELPAKGDGWHRHPEQHREQTESIVEEIERITGQSSSGPEESEQGMQESQDSGRNTLKRMMEVEVEPSGRSRDEL
ncbi:uncharacterized protein A1O9_04146 [Exophiala aquamarina CBS 119918]|uniref:Sec20 C-terminal domain-containing protein n=1 Tax=Exophiala aquamarina CBS 119918 TaxID=1182545 RepID=A0A072PHV3_9EURO|nr:uncharacterized protein A1O9_04146 [Exophiala aquamarina CBS 119918]KEF59302.1 hypothetical protein A1O9_04146 [Exophiala aquamarina CBS 119918]